LQVQSAQLFVVRFQAHRLVGVFTGVLRQSEGVSKVEHTAYSCLQLPTERQSLLAEHPTDETIYSQVMESAHPMPLVTQPGLYWEHSASVV